MGIAFCHIWLAGLHMGQNPHFARNTEAPEVLSDMITSSRSQIPDYCKQVLIGN